MRLAMFVHALLFVAGFSLVFVVGWGGAATLAGGLFSQYKTTLGRIGSSLVILFGLHTLGVVRIPFLNLDTRPQKGFKSSGQWFNSGLMGIFFAAGWTPCVGVTLGAILTLGFSQETSGQAMLLSAGYAFGLGIPFLMLAVLLDRALGVVRRMGKYMLLFQRISGVLLIVIGVLMISDRITYIAIWAQRNGFYLDIPLGGASAPTFLVALIAGALSFLSPCVLPLVPAYLGYLGGQGLNSSIVKTGSNA